MPRPILPCPKLPRPTVPAALAAVLAAMLAATGGMAPASAREKFFIYNETTAIDFVGVYTAPSGTGQWSNNQAVNDPDQVFNRTERLPLTGFSHGLYDFRLVDQYGHTCILRNVDYRDDRTFELTDRDMSGCK